MKKIFTLLSCCIFLCSIASLAQQLTKMSEYPLPAAGSKQQAIILYMPYAGFTVEAIHGDTSELKNAGEMIIDVVCTDYPSQLSLTALNQQRFAQLTKLFPFIKPSQIRQVNYVRQTDGATKERAQGMFHGIVLKYRPVQNEVTMRHDLKELEAMISAETVPVPGKKPGPALPKEKDPAAKGMEISRTVSRTDSYDEGTGVRSYLDMLGLRGKKLLTMIGDEKTVRPYYHIPDSIEIMPPQEAYKKNMISKEMFSTHRKFPLTVTSLFDYIADTSVYDFSHVMETDSTENLAAIKPLPDSTVFKIFRRNAWKNINVVGDVTGSMYPYTGQLLLWLKLHSLDSLTKRFIFFNDGDNTPDKEKKLGNTGGIYSRECSSFDEVKDLVKTTMMKGGGGDCPENNIEALLAAEKKFPEAACQVLIADNWANVKDLSLVEQLSKPVRIVLCGVYDGNVNVEYLNLARKTKGSVHLMEQDLYDLSLLHEGELLRIGRKYYRVKKGSFVETDADGTTVYPPAPTI